MGGERDQPCPSRRIRKGECEMMQSVQVIIERLKTNPEDFFGDADSRGRMPKFQGIAEKLDDLLSHKQEGFIHRLWYLNEDEKEALLEAYKEARRARFEAQVFHDLLSPQEEKELNVTTRRHPVTGKYMMPTGATNGAIIAPKNMIEAATKILRDEMDKQHAENRNT
jgi:hypothetical protein